jgi:hypothetical protein
VLLSSGDPGDEPRRVDYAPFGASTSLSSKESEGPEPPTHVKQFAGGDDACLRMVVSVAMAATIFSKHLQIGHLARLTIGCIVVISGAPGTSGLLALDRIER